MKKNKMLGFRFFKGLLGIFFLIFFRPKIVGREKIPKDGGVILAGNHRHIFDPCMPILSTKRPVHYMAKKELFNSPIGWFFKVVGCIPVDRGHDNTDSKEAALEVLREGEVLGIFPEGTRNKSLNGLLPFKYGAVSMSNKSGALIVPFAITGKYRLFNNKLTVRFGEGFVASDDLERANKRLVSEIEELIAENTGK
ncbi:MAG: 1-acyl-sn-glycerol-3-phosphate acyltransferase [Tenericutes bacterium]|nr:1-acyl-sn-glycerol-3-phosphate acyltransferase [Mycoplasmatota bacterium]